MASDDCLRILIGEDYSVWHPLKVRMPSQLRKLYPHLSLSRSQISSKLILSGRGENVELSQFLCDIQFSTSLFYDGPDFNQVDEEEILILDGDD